MLTYNRETLVTHAIESVLAQTFTDFEYIVIDNGSTDKSGAIADDYAARDNRIRVIHRVRGNIGSGRNTGLNAARGEFIAFIDDDDWCESDYLEFLYKLAVENRADVAICGVVDKACDEKLIMNSEEAIDELLWRRRYNVGFPTKLIKRNLFNGSYFSDSLKYDDIYLMPKILAKAKLVAYHGLGKYTVLRHENNNSAWTLNHELLNVDILDEYLKVYRERTDWLCGLFPKNAAKWRYFEWSFMISMVEKINRYEIRDCEKQLFYMSNELRWNREELMNCGLLLEFEREWMEMYIPECE